ncbi:MAG: hypothetical protein MJ162_07480 [Treponema sp.]|nr:hypothetical protein [Treponema sp.]
MESIISTYEAVLNQEDELLDKLLACQKVMKTAVMEKDWETLTSSINDINYFSEEFQTIDSERDVLQNQLKTEELKPFFAKLGEMRGKLTKYKVENNALGKYVNITKDFINGVVENAIPNRRNKTYSRYGKIVQPQPTSVVLNQLF